MIFNEVIDVLRSITHLYRARVREAMTILGEEVTEEVLDQQQQDGKRSLTMDKSLIMEAWARYRPSSKENSPVIKTGREGQRDIKQIYGEQFMSNLMAGIKQKVYLTKEERLNGAGDEAGD